MSKEESKDENESEDDDDNDDDDDESKGVNNYRHYSATASSDQSVENQSCTQPAYSARHKHRRSNRSKPELDYLLIATDDYKIKVYQSD